MDYHSHGTLALDDFCKGECKCYYKRLLNVENIRNSLLYVKPTERPAILLYSSLIDKANKDMKTRKALIHQQLQLQSLNYLEEWDIPKSPYQTGCIGISYRIMKK